ncbi:DNA primase family protein [Gordonia sp. 852002-10350_SCH5691597]|uniref:DNA primase family protein n=1 Tax=Gordonia sp. 852002-10350_SCH5691597 TaxID=1834085 RepID=UPI0007EBDDB2|nr:phage/plasmid primase, P4 family [Gordonia sp. 852002-10350_SCH5691597]OBA67777.1 DNA primase [Gordonia sp. 852002-10350_SCH5691597]
MYNNASDGATDVDTVDLDSFSTPALPDDLVESVPGGPGGSGDESMDSEQAMERRVADIKETLSGSFGAVPSRNRDGVPYATSTAILAATVADEYLSADNLPRLRNMVSGGTAGTPAQRAARAKQGARDVADGLLGRINDRIAYENALIKGTEDDPPALIGTKRATLNQLGFAEVARLLGALYSVVSIMPSSQNTDPDLNILAAYDDDPSSPHFGTYRSEVGHLRAIGRRYRPNLSVKEFADVLAALGDYAPTVTRGGDRDLIACRNGVVDYNGGDPVFHEFDPKYVFLAKLDVDWNPDAENPVIANPEGCSAGHADPADCTDDCLTWDVESWMASLSDDPEVVDLLWRTVGAVVRPYNSWNKAMFFYARKGNNGKGTLLSLMRNMLGVGNYASIPLADFGKDFLLEPLTRANAVLVDENDVGTFVEKAANFKAVITNDVITINRKYKAPIAHQHFGFMVQCLNDEPVFKDKSESIYRRQIFVPFEKCFTGAERRYIKDDYLRRPEVLEYVLRRVLSGDLTSPYYVLPEPAAVKKALEGFKESNDPVRAFWNENQMLFQWDLLPFPFLHEFYVAWMGRYMPNSKPIGKNKFISEIVQLVDADPTSQWYCDDHTAPIRPAQRMVDPEPLIVEYSLVNWGDTSTKPGDKNYRTRRATIPGDMIKSAYRGLLRRDDLDVVSTEFTDPFADAGDAVDPVDPPVDQASMGPAVAGGLVATGEQPTPAPAKSKPKKRPKRPTPPVPAEPGCDPFAPDYQFVNNPYA